MKKLLIAFTLFLVILFFFPFIADAETFRLEIVSGNNQTGRVSQALANPFVVKATDRDGTALSGQTVTFSISITPARSTGASLSTTTATTGTDGQASTTLTLGDTAGNYGVSVFSGLDAVLFSANAKQVQNRLTRVSGNNQTGEPGASLANAFVVKYERQDLSSLWHPVTNETIYFNLTPPSQTAGASLSPDSSTTDANGEASTTLTLGNAAGNYSVWAVNIIDNVPEKVHVFFTATAVAPMITASGSIVSGNNQTGTVSQALANPFVVKATDRDGTALSGQTVTFSIASTPAGSTGALLSTTSTTTGTDGQASTTLTLGDTTGTYTVTATVGTSTLTFTVTAQAAPKVATTLEKRSGDGQSAQVGTRLSSAFVVRVLDQDGAALSGVSVSFSVSPSSGTLSTTTTTTNAQGEASTRLTLGATTGTYTITASVGTLTATFTATAEAAPPPQRVATTLEKRSGDGQSAQVSTQLSSAFVVRVLDQDGAALSGVSVSFSVSPSSGTLSTTTTTTNAQGEASTRLTLGATTGTYTITASVGTLTATFTATAEAAPPPQRVATTLEKRSGDGQSAQVSTRLSNPFVVRVLDQDGDALSGVSVSFSVSPSGTLSTTTTTTNTQGEASTTLTLGTTDGTYTITANVKGITGTIAFTATATAPPPPPPPDKVATTLEKRSGDRQSAQVSTRLSNPFVVRVLDQDGAALSGISVSFSVSPSGTLSTTITTTDTQGEAYTTLILGSTTGTYTITATVATLTTTFTATAEAAPPPERIATTLEKRSGDGQSAEVSTQLSNAFVVRVLDQDGAALSGVWVSFSVSPSGTLSTTITTTDTQGEAYTTLILGSTTGTYTITASTAGIISTVSFTATATAETIDPETPDTTDPVVPATTPDAAWGDVVFSEVMYASNGHTDVQWIELYNTSETKTFQLEGWRLTAISPEGETHYQRSATIELKPFEIKPKQVILMVTRKNRHADVIREDQVYDLSEHHNNVLQLNQYPRRIIGITGFTLVLYSKGGIQVDRLGNISQAYGLFSEELSPYYSFKDITRTNATGRTRNKHRVSLIRRIVEDKADDGDSVNAWKRTATLTFDAAQPNSYYGNMTDIGTPGYIYEGIPLPVQLSAFNARLLDDAVILKWTTESELDNAGFNILRSETRDGDFKIVNATMIQGAGTTSQRTTYQYTDTTAKPNNVYYYQIEDVSHAGEREQLATVRLKGLVSANDKRITTWADLKTSR